MTPLTKEEKLRCYDFALDVLRFEKDSQEYTSGVCVILRDAVREVKGLSTLAHVNVAVTPIYFPEFYKLKPPNGDIFWWPHNHFETRIKVINKLMYEIAKA